ncbi:hypothetical protein [Sorangium sp. So ce1097]|uniref:hypothetical protein n=1 Tax=Sorangium sp. So ce1097 TaxID=3133330 RepID=UPI003F61ABBD
MPILGGCGCVLQKRQAGSQLLGEFPWRPDGCVKVCARREFARKIRETASFRGADVIGGNDDRKSIGVLFECGFVPFESGQTITDELHELGIAGADRWIMAYPDCERAVL